MLEDVPCSSVGLNESNVNEETTICAKAKHSFEGRNNDELSFKKGDIIVVTQQVDGGWWEGTCNSNTGWFPRDYVIIVSESEWHLRSRKGLINGGIRNTSGDVTPLTTDTSRKSYRQQVMKSFLDSEIKYGDRIMNLYNNVLMKVKTSNKLSDVDFYVLSGNLQLLVVQQNEVLESIKQAVERDGYSAKIGGILLRAAPTLQHLLRFYCENHPKAINLLMNNREIFEEVFLSVGCEFKDFIAELSLPFRHLETYSATLTELERSMNSSHPDRGDTQRAATVFRDIVNFCSFVRKQKEMQIELLTSGIVEGITLDEMNEFGEIVYMGIASVSSSDITPTNELTFDRCVVLFSSTILILEITSLMNSYILSDRISTNQLSLRKAEVKNAVVLSNIDGKLVMTLYLSTTEEFQRWVEAFATCDSISFFDSFSDIMTPCVPQKIEFSSIKDVTELSPLRKAEISHLPTSSKADNVKNTGRSGYRFDHRLEMVLPDGNEADEVSCQTTLKCEKLYSGYALRPHAAPRGNYAIDYSKRVNVKMRKEVSQLNQEDAYLLRIVEGYCSSSHLSRSNRSFITSPSNQGRASDRHYMPQLIVADDEKILVEELVGNEIVVHEKGLVDTVYALKDQIGNMQKDIVQLNKTVDSEQKARRRMEELLRRLTAQNNAPTSKLFSSASDSEYVFKKD